MTQKILIGCPTYKGQEYCLDRFIQGLKSLTYKDIEIIFVDNSEGSEYLDKLKSKDFENLTVHFMHDSRKDTRISNIISSRNIVRNFFLEGDYSHLLFLDTDIVPPTNIIEELLTCKSDIASGVYLCRVSINDNYYVIPTLYLHHADGTVKTMRRQDVTESIFDIAVCGMGSCLIKKKTLERISFRPFSDSKSGGEDVAFCYDAQKCGFSIKAHGALRCAHMGKNETLTF